MKVIHKYELKVTDSQFIRLPIGAEILTVQMQHGKPCMWALVNTSETIGAINIEIYGTGNTIHDAQREYIGTFQMEDGYLVWHVFKIILP